jgi:hypothetical protein
MILELTESLWIENRLGMLSSCNSRIRAPIRITIETPNGDSLVECLHDKSQLKMRDRI